MAPKTFSGEGSNNDEYTTLLQKAGGRKPPSWSNSGSSGIDDDTSLGLSMTDNVHDKYYDDNEEEDSVNKCRPSNADQHRGVVIWVTAALTAFVCSALLMAHGGAMERWNVRGGRIVHPSSSQPNTATNSKYTKVQYFGFQIYTGGAPAYLEDAANNFADDDDDDDEDDSNTIKNYTDNSHKTPNPECIRSPSFGQVLLGPQHPELRCYLGHEDPLVDVQQRLVIMRQAVERAYNESLTYNVDNADDDGNNSNNNGDKTLKLFVAPEFYWRGLDGAYNFVTLDRVMTDRDDCHGPICSILRGLEQIVEDERFEDWFFVFGTIIASQALTTNSSSNTDENDGDVLYYNFAPVYKGYDPKKMKKLSKGTGVPVGKRFLLPKRYIASNDFLTPHADRVNGMDWNWRNGWEEILGPDNRPNTTDNPFYGPNHEKRLRYNHDELFTKYKQQLYDDAGYTIIEYDWLMLDGLTLSLEVCFDHQKKTALNTYLGDIISGRPTRIPSSSDDGQGVGKLEYVPIPIHQAQISLVSSAGMTAVADSLALANHGTIFLQDGLNNDTSRQYLDDEMKSMCDQEVQFEGGTEAITRRAIVSNTDVNFLYEVISSDRRVPLYGNDDDDDTNDSWKEYMKDAYTTVIYEPHLLVHKPLDIAPVVVVE